MLVCKIIKLFLVNSGLTLSHNYQNKNTAVKKKKINKSKFELTEI